MATCSGGRSWPHHSANSWRSPIPGPHPQLLRESPQPVPLYHQARRCAQGHLWLSKCNLAPGLHITADLPGQQYTFPQDIAPMDLQPDMVIWSTSAIHLVELTVPYETNIARAAERKVHRYQDFANSCARSHHTTIMALEVGSRGFLSAARFQKPPKQTKASQSYRQVHLRAWHSQSCCCSFIQHLVQA